MSTKAKLADEITFMHPVKMPLTDREIIAYADELTALDTKETELTLRHEGEKGQYKSELKTIEKGQERVMHLLKVKEEYKDVECYNDFDYFEGIVTVRKVDDDSQITTRKMQIDEFKRDLPFKDEASDENENN